MPRTTRGPIDLLSGFTVTDPVDGTTAQDDYYEMGNLTIWGVGLITFGAPTDAQLNWIANGANYANLATFPGDWVSFGFPYYYPDAAYYASPIAIWPIAGLVRITPAIPPGSPTTQTLVVEQGIKGATAWSINGQTGTGTYFFSDASTINGTSASEPLNGTAVAETLNGLGGNDTINAGGGSDALHGGAGDDVLNGGTGPDRLWGDDGNDILNPGSDAAFIYVAGGVNRAGVYFVDGGAGTDTLVLDYSAATQSQSISGGQVLASPQVLNVEQLSITGSQFSDFLTGSSGNDQLYGGGGFDYLSGGAGNDWLDAGAPGASSVGPVGEGGHANSDALSLDHLFTAGVGDPSVTFTIHQTEANVVSWGARPEAGTIYSFTVDQAGAVGHLAYNITDFGSNVVFDFTVTDENGVEVPIANFNDPIVFPHAGTYYLDVDVVNTNPWAQAYIDVTLSLEGASVLANNELIGGTGDDTYVIYAASDHVVENAGEGTDTVRSGITTALMANVENLTLTGSSAINGTGNTLNNILLGNSAQNTLSAGAGADIVAGGAGADNLSGGSGRDVFIFTATELGTTRTGPHDTILDYQSGDLIDISALYEGVTFKGLKPGKVGDVASLSGFKVISYTVGGNTYLSGDTNGVAGADFTIQINGSVKLNAKDLIVNASDWAHDVGTLNYAYYHHDNLWV